MKRFSWVVTILLVTSMCLGFVGCKEPPIEPTVDKTPPAEVTLFYVTIEKGSASLSWVNPSDTDFAGVQISMIPAEGILVNPISLGKDATSFTVSGLEVDCTYRFTIKTFDNSQNYSKGATQIITIENNNPSQGDDSPGDSGNDNPSGGGSSESTDTTAPAQVTNLSAVYDAQTLQIAISWTNPQDEDFAGTVLEYGKTSSTEKTTLTFDKSYSSTVIQGIAADDSEYVVYVKTKDTSGNLSQVTSITVIAVNDEIVVPEGLRTGDYVLTDNTYVRKEYYSELTQEERAKIFGIVLITDSGVPLILGTQFFTNESRWTASPVGIDTYLADIATGVYVDGTYIFTGDLDGADNWEYICSVDPTNTQGTQVTSMYPAFCLANIYATYAGLAGTDFADGWYVPTISELYQMYKNISTIKSSLTKLGISLPYTYDDNLDEYTCRDFWSSSVPTAFGTTAYELDYHTGEITNVDRGTNSNYVWVFHKFNNKFNCYEYLEAQITNVELDTTGVGESYTGTIPVTITGKNLLAYDITSQDSNLSNINYISNTEATAEIDCNNSVGSHLVTINCGTAIETATYNVIEAEKCFAVGDILFTDGTRVKVENVQYGIPDGQISKAFGVIVSTSYDGAVGKAVGLQRGTSLKWVPGGTTGLNTNFTEIQGDTTSGDMDGSDNWDYICSVDPTGSADAATNYPAFNFANTYGQIAGLTGTDYEDGWYLPAIAELKSVYDNRHIVAESLSAVGGAETLGSYCYCWSSCQYAYYSSIACSWDFGYGTLYSHDKFEDLDVLVVQAFNCEQFNDYEIENAGTSIKSVKIASAGVGYTGELLVTITGTNLKNQPITCSDASFDNLTYLSNSVATATIDCTGGSVTFYCGNSSVTKTAKIISSSNCLTDSDIGKIVLSDGTFVAKEDFNSSMTPIAVVVGIKNNGGQAVAVGLQRGTNLMWAPIGTTGYNKDFWKIQGTITMGDKNGSDNWAEVCKVDPNATVYPATNYPAFNFANTYGITAGLTDTDYKNGWYVPSVAELDAVFANKSTIQESLDVVGGFTIDTSSYWSSSQSYSYATKACKCYFFGSYGDDNKYSDTNVLVFQDFNAQ